MEWESTVLTQFSHDIPAAGSLEDNFDINLIHI